MSADSPVSVVIPTFNHARYLPEAIESALRQTIPVYEIIVVDDGSNDETASLMAGRGAPVRYIRQEQRGTGAARNRGAGVAEGRYLAFLDADDLWHADALRSHLAFLEEHPECQAVFGHVEEFYSPELSTEVRVQIALRHGPRPFYAASTMLVTRTAFERTGGFATGFRVGEFIDWYLRATEGGLRTAMSPDLVLRRRLHAGHLDRPTDVTSSDYVRILRDSLVRRRLAGVPGTPPARHPSR